MIKFVLSYYYQAIISSNFSVHMWRYWSLLEEYKRPLLNEESKPLRVLERFVKTCTRGAPFSKDSKILDICFLSLTVQLFIRQSKGGKDVETSKFTFCWKGIEK